MPVFHLSIFRTTSNIKTRLRPTHFVLSGLLLCIFNAQNSFAVDPRPNWFTLQTPHFLIHYPAGNENLATLISERAENIHIKLSPWFAWQPKKRTHIVLNTSTSRANGSALSIPYNRIELHTIIPEVESKLSDFSDWWTLLLTHEYAHILHIDKKTGIPLFLRNKLGRIPLLYPNLYQPRWIIEGLATHLETDTLKQTGRGQSSTFNMMINEELINDFKSLHQVNLHQSAWPYSTPYLYGSYFFNFIEQEYGEESIRNFIAEYSNNIVPFALNTTSNTVFDKSLYTLWEDYENHLKAHVALTNTVESGKQALTKSGFLQGPLQHNEEGALLFIENNGKRHPALWKISTNGDRSKITELQPGAFFDSHASSGFIISQPEICEEYNVYYDLFIFSKKDKTPRQITHCAQYHYASWHPSGKTIAAVKVTPLYSQIDILKNDGSFIKTLWTSRKNERLSALDWNKDGNNIVTSLHTRNTGWNIHELNVNTGSMRRLTADWAVKSSPQYEKSGHIIYSSDYNGVSNIYELDPKTKSIKKLSGGPKGKFYPLLIENKKSLSLAYMQYGPSGLDIYQQTISGKQSFSVGSKLDKEQVNNPAPTPIETPTDTASLNYSPWSSLKTPGWMPNFFISDEQTFIGAILMGADALQLHIYEFSIAYEAEHQQLYSFLNYQYNNRFFLNYEHDSHYFFSGERLDFILNNHQVEAYYRIPYSRLESQWDMLLGTEFTYNTWDRLSPFFIKPGNSLSQLFGAAVLYNSSHRYIRGISNTEGRQVYIALENTRQANNHIVGNSLTFDWREYIPIKDTHVLALRGVYVRSSSPAVQYFLGDDFSDPFNNLTNIFNRRDYPLRGYKKSFNKLSGSRLILTSAEWRFPVTNIERTLMSPPVGFQKIHGKLFFDSGAAWSGGINEREFFSSAGVELIAEAKLFYYYPLNVRLGYAKTEETESDNFYGSLGLSF